MKKKLCLCCFQNEGLKHLDYLCSPCFKRALKSSMLEDYIAEEIELENFIAGLVDTAKHAGLTVSETV